MALIKRNKMDLHDKALLENTEANVEKNAAMIEYIAMMADIDIWEDGGAEMSGATEMEAE